jgi:3-dehydroquinate dehydratase-2
VKKIRIINGPNLNLLGRREPLLYGAESFAEFFTSLKEEFENAELGYVQVNGEGELIEAIHRAGDEVDGIVLNPAAYSHTSIGVADAVAAVMIPVIEVHISNIYTRESFRHHSYVSRVSTGVIAGFGLDGYRLGVIQLLLL